MGMEYDHVKDMCASIYHCDGQVSGNKAEQEEAELAKSAC